MGTRKKANLWKVIHRRKGGQWVERPESKAKVYRYIEAEVANWLCGALPDPYVEVWVDERDGHGWRLYERINLDELAQTDRAEHESA